VGKRRMNVIICNATWIKQNSSNAHPNTTAALYLNTTDLTPTQRIKNNPPTRNSTGIQCNITQNDYQMGSDRILPFKTMDRMPTFG